MQTKIYIINILVFCSCFKISAQADFGLLNHVQVIDTKIYVDTTNAQTINQINSSDYSAKFSEIPKKRFLAKSNETYWYQLDLDSIDLSVLNTWYLSFRYYDKITLYIEKNGKTDSIQAGVRNYRNEGINDFTDIPFSHDQLIQGRYIFAKINNYNNAHYIEPPVLSNDFYIGFLDTYRHKNYFKKQIPYFIFIGGISLILSYFVGIYFLYRDTQFIIYSLYLFSLLLYLGVKATLIQDFIRLNAPNFIYYYNSVIQVIVNIFYLVFALFFLNAKKDFPLLYKLIRVTILLLSGIAIFQTVLYLFYPFSGFEEKILIMERYYMIAFSLFAYVYIFKNYKNKLALFFVGGSFIFLSGAALAMFFRNIHYMMYGAAVEIFIFSLGMGYRIKQIENEKIKIENEMIKTELTALRAQMNPHFIFNSLNSIRAYVISNEIKKASRYITKFSKLVRLILHYSSKESISLQDELDALRLYIQLEELRFRTDFGFKINIEEGIEPEKLALPPLILQPYVENAVRHGLAPKEGIKNLEIFVSKKNNQIEYRIRDNGVGRKLALNNHGNSKKHVSMAMDLTKRRINLNGKNQLINENIKIVDLKDDGQAAGTMVILNLPNKQISKTE